MGRRIVHPPGLWPMHFGEAITVGKTVFAIFWAIIFDPTPSYANDWLVWNWTSLDQPCAGDCYGMAYAGRYVDNSMRNAFAIDEFRWPTQYDYGDSKFLGFAAGRRLATIGEALTIEPEIGLGRRFGADASTEAWAAMFLRWSWFPWNSVVRTSIAVSTGLNYAFEVTPLEIGRANNGGKGSHLMHYLAPEAAFALPQHPDFELLFRFHHRSGGREIFCDSGIFNCAVGGSQYLSAGFRVRF